mmetsp:Transcript_122461/g.341652  ORF Transcript_122461/g.341652 Transcript_122461/m.341652 type:complete len:224 (-) Transcript_122461:129-800(-)
MVNINSTWVNTKEASATTTDMVNLVASLKVVLDTSKSWGKTKDMALPITMTTLNKILTNPVGLADTTRIAVDTVAVTTTTITNTKTNTTLNTGVSPTEWAIKVTITTNVEDMVPEVWAILTQCSNKEFMAVASKTTTTRRARREDVETTLCSSFSKALPTNLVANKDLDSKDKHPNRPQLAVVVQAAAGRTIKAEAGAAVLPAGKGTTIKLFTRLIKALRHSD